MGRKIDETKLRKFCINALVKSGMSDENANIMSEVLITTDKWGVFTHGVKNLYGYIEKKKQGGVSFDNELIYEAEYPSLCVIDANNTMGYISAVKAMNKACEYATKNGIGISFVKNSTHFGACGYYANIAASKGMIGIALSNVDKKMTIPGAKGMVMGHNPFAMAAPAKVIPSVILDISSSNVASLKVLKAKAAGESVPDTWIIDKNGIPTTDPSKYPDEGALLPFGGHKGYGIAMFVEILTSVILGKENSTTDDVRSWCFDMDKPNNVCHSFTAINPNMVNGGFLTYMDALIEDMHNIPKADGTDEITVPGERMWRKYCEAEKEGIALPEDAVEELEKVAIECGLELGIYRENH